MIKHIRNMRGAVVVWLVTYIFFLLTLANNFSASHDSINYLLHISRGEHLFHQHHLLYHFLAHKWVFVFSAIFSDVPKHLIIEAFTAFWGSANLALCYLFFRDRFNLPVLLSAAGVAVIAFSYGTWFYSINIEVYAPPIFFILSALYVIARKELRTNDIVLIAFLHSAAILLHQLNILFTVVVLFWIFTKYKRSDRLSSLLSYAIITAIICGAMYFYTGWFVEKQNTAIDFANWVLGYTKGHSYWQPLSFKTPLNAGTGLSRAFIGGHFAFQLPFLQDIVQNSFGNHSLRDEIFLTGKMSSSTAWLLTIAALWVGLLTITLVARFAMTYKKMTIHFNVIHPLLLTIVVYSVFFCFWMPEILEFWILQMMLIWLLIIGMLPVFRFPFNIKLAPAVFIIAAMLFIVNYFGSITWLRNFENDWYHVETKKLDPTLSKDDIVVLEDEWILKDYVRFYTNATVIATDEPGYNAIEAEQQVKHAVAQNRKVYMHRKNGQVGNSWVLIRSY
jgi:hypothetical protein